MGDNRDQVGRQPGRARRARAWAAPVPWENIGGRAEFITFSLDGIVQLSEPDQLVHRLRGGRAGTSLHPARRGSRRRRNERRRRRQPHVEQRGPDRAPRSARPPGAEAGGGLARPGARHRSAVIFLAQPLLLIIAGIVFASMLDGGTRLLGRVLPIGRGWRLAIVTLAGVGFIVWTFYFAGIDARRPGRAAARGRHRPGQPACSPGPTTSASSRAASRSSS